MSTKKCVYIEIMRFIAIFFVIFNHTGNKGFFLFSLYSPNSIQFWMYLFLSIFCKFAVPLFLLISGALLLNKPDENLITLYRHRILKFAIILVFYSFLYYTVRILSSGSTFSWKEFVIELISITSFYHLWYLYLYLGFLAVLPFLRALVKNLSNKNFIYLFCIAVFSTGILPTIEYLRTQGTLCLNANLRFSWLVGTAVLYPCLGYFLQHRVDIKKCKKFILPLWVLNLGCIFLVSYLTLYKYQVTGTLSELESQTFFDYFTVINSITVFITLKYCFENIQLSTFLQKLILSVGSCSFVSA